jgi:anti-anti-sigma factor
MGLRAFSRQGSQTTFRTGRAMDMQVADIAQGAVRVTLKGRLDIGGAAQIDLTFNAVIGSQRGVVVDMSEVTFLASIGIRTLVLGAKQLQRRGGHLVVLSPHPDVEKVLEMTGVTDLLPIMRDEASAVAAVTA